jgi:hypothetical protein
MQSVEIHGKKYFKIHELTRAIKETIEKDVVDLDLSAELIKDYLMGINHLAVELENEFLYRGDLLRRVAVILDTRKLWSLEPSEN